MQNSTQQKMEVCAPDSGLFMNGPTYRREKIFSFFPQKVREFKCKIYAAEDGGLCPRLRPFYERSHLQMKEIFLVFSPKK
jgi:hypothetical protein